MDARIKFRKYGVMKYVGHLDMMRFFQKLLRRSELPIAYSEGFSPHMIMSFAAPLGIGLTSDAEYLDVRIEKGKEYTFNEDVWIDLMNSFVPEGIEVVRAMLLPENNKGGMASVSCADYEVYPLKSDNTSKSRLNSLAFYKWDDFIAQESILIEKKSKKTTKEVDLKNLIYDSVHITNPENEKVFLRVAQGSEANLKPELVLEAYCKYCGREYEFSDYQIHRIEVYEKDEANGTFIPLIPYKID